MAVEAIFPGADLGRGMYESFYLRAVAPDEPVGVWLRYTVRRLPNIEQRDVIFRRGKHGAASVRFKA
ncbi:MAG: hypothetical protein WCF17_04585 [Terracidiphilus sp.]